MSESTSILEGLTDGFKTIAEQVLTYLPKLAIAFIVLVIGWLLARLFRTLMVRAIGRVDKLWQRLISKHSQVRLQPRHPPARVAGELLFWLMMLIFVTIATEILGLNVFGAWLNKIGSYLPLAVAGMVIVLVGFVVSSLIRDLVESAADSAELSYGSLLGRTAQVLILLIAIIIGIDQVGIDIEFLSVIAGIILAAMLGGVALAFGLGAQTHVSNIIAANQMRQSYHVGDQILTGDIEGRILDITASRVIIETTTGNIDVPAKLFGEQTVTLVKKDS